jgi:ribosome-interacting GTPase 1
VLPSLCLALGADSSRRDVLDFVSSRVPTNLPPPYFEAERDFRSATTPQAKVEALERMLAVMPHHKGTDHLRAELRSRMAKLSHEVERQRGGSRHADIYAVHREGAGQAVVLGPANAGKSSLVHALTGAPVRVAEFPFTTQLPQPAMMPFEDIQVQLVDVPAVAASATPGWLRSLVTQADLLLLVVDLDTDPVSDLQLIRDELDAMHVQPVPPGGAPAAPVDTLSPRPALVVGTKLDLHAADDGAELLRLELADQLPFVPVSAESSTGLEELRRRIIEALDVVRVYAKPPGRPPDLTRPFVLRRGATVEDLAAAIHKEIREKLRFAVRFADDTPPLRVAHHYELRDRDVLEVHAD